jgi:hypothetical protein
MSLLDQANEDVVVYLEEEYEDSDGNAMSGVRDSTIGIPARVRLEIQGQSGTSSRRQETDSEGFETEKVYTMKFPRSWPHVLGAQSQIEWRGERWAVFGDVQRYNRSPRTAHLAYTIRRN